MKREHRRMLIEALNAFGRCDVRVFGGSMKPFIRAGDTVVIEPVRRKIGIGMVAAFFGGDRLIVHRVIGHCRRDQVVHLRVRGDSSPGSAGWIPETKVIGAVGSVIRNGRAKRLWSCLALRLCAVVIGTVLGFAAGIVRRKYPTPSRKILPEACRCPWNAEVSAGDEGRSAGGAPELGGAQDLVCTGAITGTGGTWQSGISESDDICRPIGTAIAQSGTGPAYR